MYLEEKLINGIVHYRTEPDGEFRPWTIQELSDRYMRVVEQVNVLFREAEAARGG